MDEIVEKLHTLLFSNLVLTSPILSGNMQSMITGDISEPGERTIIIDAPFYDMARWEKEGVIVWTGEMKDGKSAYAYDVNMEGGFGTHNKSMHWVNRSILEVVNIVASEIGAEVIYEL